ncbi:MAG: sialate O-acetylesterase, partial [Prevotella sp.]|nr:sialate O-acetylesterase [Prevotella sp.]
MRRVLLFCIVLATSANVFAKVKLPRLFSDGVVLQRGQVVPVWGEADANEPITLTMGKKSYSTQADEQGKWRIDLPKMKAGGPFQIVVNDITIHDVWVGDVWLFSGQSNIDIHLERVYPQYPEEIE